MSQEKVATNRDCMPLYAEVNHYFEEKPKIIPQFEIDVVDIITPYISNEAKEAETSDIEDAVDDKTLRKVCLQQEVMEKEMQVSQKVHASALEELNVADNDSNQCMVLIPKDMQSDKKTELKELLRQYKDVFAWSFEDMKGLDLAFC